MQYEYSEDNRSGDHICYISNLAKMRSHYPTWQITRSLDDIFLEIHRAASAKIPIQRSPESAVHGINQAR